MTKLEMCGSYCAKKRIEGSKRFAGRWGSANRRVEKFCARVDLARHGVWLLRALEQQWRLPRKRLCLARRSARLYKSFIGARCGLFSSDRSCTDRGLEMRTKRMVRFP